MKVIRNQILGLERKFTSTAVIFFRLLNESNKIHAAFFLVDQFFSAEEDPRNRREGLRNRKWNRRKREENKSQGLV